MKYIFSLVLILVYISSFGQIRGFVKDANNKAVKDVNIVVKGTNKGGITDAEGYFSISYTKSCTLIVTHLSYIEQEYRVSNPDTIINIVLEERLEQLDDVKISGIVKSGNKLTATGREIEEIPAILGESDIIKYLAGQSGITTINGLDGGLYIRGGNSFHNEFLSDGYALYNPNHLSGILSAFDPYVFSRTNTYKSGFPANYGGKLSSYIDMIPRIGDKKKYEHKLSLGFISSSIRSNGPLIRNKSSYVLSMRASYLQHITKLYNDKFSQNSNFESIPSYSFYDFSFNTHTNVTDKLVLSSTVIASKDKLKIKHDGLCRNNFKWNTFSGMIKLAWYINPKSRVRLQSGYNRTFTNFEIFLFKVSKQRIINQSYQNKIEYQKDFSDKLRIFSGVKHEYSIYELDTNLGNNRDIWENTYDNNFNVFSAYQGAEWNVYKEVLLEAGLRLDYYYGKTTHTGLSPRFRVSDALSDKLTVSADFAKTIQHTTLYSVFSINTPSDLWYPLEKGTEPSVCYQYSAQFDYKLNSSISLAGGVFYKRMKNIKEFRDGTSLSSFDNMENLIIGSGEAKGIESELSVKSSNFDVDCNYTLSESYRRFDEINNGKSYYPPFDIRHSVSVNFKYNISNSVKFNAIWNYASGNHVTFPLGITVSQGFTESQNSPSVIPIYEDRYNYKLPASHRLDFNIFVTRHKKSFDIIYAAGAYNVYNRANPTFLYFVPEMKDAYLKVLVPKIKSLLPFIPYFSVTFKFD